MTTDGVTNACVEFDVETLRPTYRLSIGVPGRSNAFEISARLGLDEAIIQRARDYVSGENVRFEEVIASAQEQQRLAREQIENTRQALLEAQQARSEAIRSRDAWIKQRDRMLEVARAQAAQSVQEAKREGQRILEEMNRMLKSGAQIKPHQMHALQKKFDEKLDTIAPAPPLAAQATQEGAVGEIAVGMTVLYKRLNQKATVLRLPDDQGRVQIQIGSMKLMADKADLYLTAGKAAPPSAPAAQKTTLSDVGRTLPLQLDLRGMTIEEARLQVDQYLDDALLAGLTQVTIVHGKGTGALRAGVRAYLKTHPLVKSVREGKFSEGEDGVSIVTLR